MVGVASNPPGWLPVKTSGFKLARAVYKAAVHPAQPEPMITTFSIEPRKLVFQLRVGKGRFDLIQFQGSTFKVQALRSRSAEILNLELRMCCQLRQTRAVSFAFNSGAAAGAATGASSF